MAGGGVVCDLFGSSFVVSSVVEAAGGGVVVVAGGASSWVCCELFACEAGALDWHGWLRVGGGWFVVGGLFFGLCPNRMCLWITCG